MGPPGSENLPRYSCYSQRDAEATGRHGYPEGAVVPAIAVIDREGIPHEAEWTNLQGEKFVGVPTPEKVDIYNIMARSLAESWYKDRFHPALIDGKTCEVTSQMRIIGGALQVWGTGLGQP